MQKAQQNAAKKEQLPLRKTGTKQAPPDLTEFIRLANLVPDGKWLPPDLMANLSTVGGTWTELLERLHEQDLPPDVRAELIEVSRQVEPEPNSLMWELRRFIKVLRHYERIRVAYYNLRGLLWGPEASVDPLDLLLRALGHADLSYLRRCPKADCGRIFYAGKHTQQGCTTEHSNAIRQQRKRDRDKENRQNKKKRAKTARKR